MICGYFTPHYAEPAERLIEQLNRLRLPHAFTPVDDAGSWRDNIRMKPRLVAEALKMHGEILWLDADAFVFRIPERWVWERYPQGDFIARLRPPSKTRKEDGLRGGVSTGTMFLRATAEVMAMIEAWPGCQYRAEKTTRRHAHEPGLFDAYMMTPNVKHVSLPWEYIVVQNPKQVWSKLVSNGWAAIGTDPPTGTVVGHFYTTARRLRP